MLARTREMERVSMDKPIVLWEIEQIKQLKACYMRLLDTRNWPEFRELFNACSSML